MSETRIIKATDGWTILVHPSGAIEAHDADRAVWVGLDSDDCLHINVDGAEDDGQFLLTASVAIPTDVARAVLSQSLPLPAELIDGEWFFGGSEGEPDAAVIYTKEPSPETGHVGWCWWAHGKMGDAESMLSAMAAAEAALNQEPPGG